VTLKAWTLPSRLLRLAARTLRALPLTVGASIVLAVEGRLQPHAQHAVFCVGIHTLEPVEPGHPLFLRLVWNGQRASWCVQDEDAPGLPIPPISTERPSSGSAGGDFSFDGELR